MILSTCLFVLILIVLVSLFGPKKIIYFESGIYYGYDLILEYKLFNALDKVKETQDLNTEIHIQEFDKKQIIRVCAQSPYITQEIFEEKVGHKVRNFSEISDNYGYVLWLFFSDGSSSRARPGLYYFMNNSKSICIDNNFIISFVSHKRDQEYLKFYFVEDK